MRSFPRKLNISISLNYQFYFIKFFFANPKQCVTLGIALSDKITFNYRDPQETVLGTHILLLYVNNFSEKLEGEKDNVQFAYGTSNIYKLEIDENVPFKIEKNVRIKTQILDRESFHIKCR